MKKTITFLAAALMFSASLYAQVNDSYEVFIPEEGEDELLLILLNFLLFNGEEEFTN